MSGHCVFSVQTDTILCKQQYDNGLVSILGGSRQRCLTRIIVRLDISTLLEQ